MGGRFWFSLQAKLIGNRAPAAVLNPSARTVPAWTRNRAVGTVRRSSNTVETPRASSARTRVVHAVEVSTGPLDQLW